MLTDFGLSRFVEIDEDGDAELLSTRCGSEAYAAPELVMGGGGSSSTSGNKSRRGVYDARETDAWACGVVLYALVGRRLPFGEGVGAGGEGKIGGEKGEGKGGGGGGVLERRQWLMRIARGEWEWPGGELERDGVVEDGGELVGERLVESQGARRMVGRLLVRDPRKRARVSELWDDEWMWTSGCVVPENVWRRQEEQQSCPRLVPIDPSPSSHSYGEDVMFTSPVDEEGRSVPILRVHDGEEDDGMDVDDGKWIFDDEDGEGEVLEDGLLLDQEGIDSIARQEVV
jgi:protein-serine/threonine kinase